MGWFRWLRDWWRAPDNETESDNYPTSDERYAEQPYDWKRDGL